VGRRGYGQATRVWRRFLIYELAKEYVVNRQKMTFKSESSMQREDEGSAPLGWQPLRNTDGQDDRLAAALGHKRAAKRGVIVFATDSASQEERSL